MKLVIVLAVVACTYAAKLDRTYLPPPGAASAGGSPGSLSTPNRPGSSFDQSGKPTNGRENFGVNDGSINNGPITSYNHAPQGIAGGGSNINVQSHTETDFGTPPAGVDGHSSQPSHTAHSVDGSVTSSFGSDQATFDNHDENNQNYGNQDSTRPERPQASADRTAETLRYDQEIDGDSFAYSFETSNGISAEENGVATNGVQAQGGYSYIGDDGQQYKVTYTANENGYLPQGDHLPTPPPIPDEILKSIEENAKAAADGTQEGAYHEDDNLSTISGPTEGSIQYQRNQNGQNIPNVQTGQPGNDLSQSEHQNQYNPSSLGSTSNSGRQDFQTPTIPSVFGQSNPQSSLSGQQNVGPHTTNIGQQQIPTFNQQSSQTGYNYNRPASSQSFDSRPSQTKDVVPNRPQQNNFATSSPGNEIYQYNAPKPQSPQYNGPQSQNSEQSGPNYQNSQSQRPQYVTPKSQIAQYSAPKSQVPQYTAPQPQAQKSQFTNLQSQDSKYTAPRPQTPQFVPSRLQEYVAPTSQITQNTQSQSPQYTAPKAQFSQNQGSSQQTPQYTAPKYKGNQNIPQAQSPKYTTSQQNTQLNALQPQSPQSLSPQYNAPQPQPPKYTAPKQQAPQYSAPNHQTQFNAPQPQSPQSLSPQSPQYNAPQPQPPKYTAPKQQAPQYSAPNHQTQFNAPQPQSPQSLSPQSPQYNAPQPQPPKYTAPKQQAPQYSAINSKKSHFYTPQQQSPQYSPSGPQNPQYNAPQLQSPKYTAPKPQYPQSGSSRPQVPQYNQQQPQSTQFVPSKPQPSQQYASNKGYQYNAPTGQPFEEPRPNFNNQSQNGPFGSQDQKFNNGPSSTPQKPSGSLGGSTAQYQPTTTSPNFVPLGQKTQTPGEDFSGPRQPPSFSPEEGYRY